MYTYIRTKICMFCKFIHGVKISGNTPVKNWEKMRVIFKVSLVPRSFSCWINAFLSALLVFLLYTIQRCSVTQRSMHLCLITLCWLVHFVGWFCAVPSTLTVYPWRLVLCRDEYGALPLHVAALCTVYCEGWCCAGMSTVLCPSMWQHSVLCTVKAGAVPGWVQCSAPPCGSTLYCVLWRLVLCRDEYGALPLHVAALCTVYCEGWCCAGMSTVLCPSMLQHSVLCTVKAGAVPGWIRCSAPLCGSTLYCVLWRLVLCRDEYGALPLHVAALHGHPEMVHFLLLACPQTVR